MQKNQQLNSELKAIKEFLESKIQKEELSKKLAKAYLNLLKAVDQLTAKTDEFYTPNQDGSYKVMSLEDRDNLIIQYQNIVKSNHNILNNESDTEIAKILKENCEKINNCISSDIRAFLKMKKPCTLKEVTENSRTKVIDVTNQEKNMVGGNQSSRRVIKNNDKKGVFTELTYYNFENAIQKNIQEFSNKYPQYASIFKQYTKPEYYKNIKFDIMEPDLNETGVYQFGPGDFLNWPSNSHGEKYSKHIESNLKNEIVSKLRSDNLFGSVFYDFLHSVALVNSQRLFNDVVLQVNKDEPIDVRNSAMSVVAELLGMDNLLAHSENVVIQDGDEKKIGTMMDFAQGLDINDIDPKSDIAKVTTSHVKVTKEAKKQISNLQILDFICGNLDRHAANLFYQYDMTDPKNPKLTGIQGIDNDCSFYKNKEIDSLYGHNNMVGLANLFAIDVKTADRIKTITGSMLKVCLQGLKLDQASIDAAVERLEQLQNVVIKKSLESTIVDESVAIRKKKEVETIDDVGINIFDDTVWEAVPHKWLEQKKENNLFYKVNNSLGGAHDLRFHHDDYRKAFETRLGINKCLFETKGIIGEQSITLAKGNRSFRGSSKQYKAIEREIIEAANMENRLNNESSASDYRAYQKKLATIEEHAGAYLERKQREGYKIDYNKSGYTQDRVNYMDNVRKYVQYLSQQLDEKIKPFEKVMKRIEDKKETLEIVKINIAQENAIKEAKRKAEKQKQAANEFRQPLDKILENNIKKDLGIGNNNNVVITQSEKGPNPIEKSSNTKEQVIVKE